MNIIQIPVKTCIENSRVFYNKLNELLIAKDEITLDFSCVERIDISIFFIIMALKKRYMKSGKIIRLKNISDNIRKRLKSCGIKVCESSSSNL